MLDREEPIEWGNALGVADRVLTHSAREEFHVDHPPSRRDTVTATRKRVPGPGPQAAPAAAPYYYPPPPPRRGFWGKFFLTILVLAVAGSFFLNLCLMVVLGGNMLGEGTLPVREKYVSHDKNAEDKIVILPIEGIIQENADGFVKRAIDTAMEDKHVKALVLRVDSPGGTVAGSDYIYHHLCNLAEKKKIPIVVSMGSMAASGGYYVSMAVGHAPDTIFAEPTCAVGSIGVIIPHFNFAGFMKKYGLADDSIASHRLKEMGSPTKEMTPEEKQIFQKLVNDDFEQFKKVVRAGRIEFEKNPQKLEDLATGQLYSAEQAAGNKKDNTKGNGLIDKIGYLEDAVDQAIKLAKLDGTKVKVVRYKQESGLSSILFGGQSSKSQSLDLNALLEMTTPKAYYLASSLPGLAAAAK